MKKSVGLCLIYLLISFVLSGLQGSLYFFPIAMPFFWVIILTYYSFKKSLLFSLLANLAHIFVITAFTTMPPAQLLLIVNLISLSFYFLRERFHTNQWHMTAASASATFAIFLANWLLGMTGSGFYYPQFLTWLGASFITLLVAPAFIFILQKIDQRIEFERIDTLANLRV